MKNSFPSSRFLARLFLAPVFLLTLSYATPSLADEQVEARRKVVAEVQEAVNRGRAEIRTLREEQQIRLSELRAEDVTPVLLDQAQIDFEAARVQRDSADIDRQTALHAVQELKAALKELSERAQQLKGRTGGPAKTLETELAELQAAIEQKKGLLAVEELHLLSRQETQAVAEDRLRAASEWLKALQNLFRTAQEQSQRVALEDLQARSEAEQQSWLTKAGQWRKELEAVQGDQADVRAQRQLLETRVQDAEERARLAQMTLKLAQTKSRIDALQATPTVLDTEALRLALEQSAVLVSELGTTEALLKRKIGVLRSQEQVIAKRPPSGAADRSQHAEELRIVERLTRSVEEKLSRTRLLLSEAEDRRKTLSEAHEESVRRGLWTRQNLPANQEEWTALLQGLAALPGLLSSRLIDSTTELLAAVTAAGPDRWLLLALLELTWFGVIVWVRSRFQAACARSSAAVPTFASHLSLSCGQLMHGSFAGVVGALIIPLLLVDMPQPGLAVLATVLLAWLSVRILTNLAWVLLLSPQVARRRQRPRLYRQLKWMLNIGALLLTLTVLGHVVAAPPPLQNFVDRLFMLFLMAITLPALEARRLALDRMAEQLGERYWTRVVRLLSLLIPLSILFGSAVGLAGYINLAWTTGKYLATLLIVLSGWLVLARLLRDLAFALKNYANLRSDYAILWGKAFIDPLYTLVRLALSVALLAIPLHIYGWSWDSPSVLAVRKVLETPLLSIGTTAISLQGLLLTALLGVGLIQLGRWLRLVTYRWAYARISDLGVRHSLSVFTQYTVVLVGLLITLRLIGIDLTTLAIFAGALGVGIGFGLQNIANNFISGILLLIERPLRTSDIVRVGGYEGEVTHIGMRSLTVKTWDNQEVIMPNSEIISNAFTNWTHSDNIVRTAFTIGVSYDADPHRTQALLESVLLRHPAIESEPSPGVWLQEFAASSVNFHVQFFVDLRRRNRMDVKSEILLAIWDELRAAGITIPYPRQELYIRSVPAMEEPEQPGVSGSAHLSRPRNPQVSIVDPQ